MKSRRNTRRNKRVKTKIRVHCKTEGIFFSDFTRDICVDGVGVESTVAIMKGTIVDLHLHIPGETEPIITKGRVIWSNTIIPHADSNSNIAIGIEFEELSDIYRGKLLNFIENQDIKQV